VRRKFLILTSLLSLSFACLAPTDKPRNLILIIGDGMGPQQLGFLINFSKLNQIRELEGIDLNTEQFLKKATTGYMLTYPYKILVADSASSATQIALGKPSRSEMIGLDYEGNKAETILEKANQQGFNTGLISNTRITHATPASFAAHQPHRSMESSIAKDFLTSKPDLILSAGLAYFLPAKSTRESLSTKISSRIPKEISISSRRKDDLNLLKSFQQLGYQTVFSKDQLIKIESGKVLGLFQKSAMPDSLQIRADEKQAKRYYPTLKEMTDAALTIFKNEDDPFFLMIEAGQIDWASHNNDAGTLLHELLQFDEMLGSVYSFAKNNSDTLVVITADHSTGGFGLSYSRSNLPAPVKLPGDGFEDFEYAPAFNFGTPKILEKMYNQKESFATIIAKYDSLPEGQQTANNLRSLIFEATGYKLSVQSINKILATETNNYFKAAHKYLSQKKFPKVEDFKAFYTYGSDVRMPLIGRQLAEQQMVTWSTGTHTDTPVILFAYGPGSQNFNGVKHSTRVGQLMQNLLGL
jgi:alkaline phosphatase